CQQYSDLLTF
nr:immunoglobulin light chain junction region [Macaca mulatta]MOX85408.1 immunoglobulin light chain junction region [Macaca mulatta]MOX85574.1 immunoglobulin light chain junction region [Macaca mulatta]MOX86033.1 immunoglobulin light chain junction region [Macaca mulatta]MOX86466.1 immunoglobulin light chain junction region [Macaca mulatta]